MPTPLSGFNPSCGTAGRVQAAAPVIDLTAAFVDYTTAPVRAVLAGIRQWQSKADSETARSRHFESPTTPEGLVGSRLPLGGTVKYTVSFEAEQSGTVAAISENSFAVGKYLLLDLLKNKYSTLGRYAVPVKIMSLGETVKIEGTDINLIQVEAEVDGLLPAFSFGP